MVVENIIIEQVQGSITQVYNLLTYVTGGVVGLYLILIVLRWYELRKMKRVMNHVESHLKRLSQDVHQLKIESRRKR